MNILIFTASTGGGHKRAAAAIKAKINNVSPQTNVEVIDGMEAIGKVYNKATVTGIEIDDAAAIQATENVASSPFHERIDIEHCALQDFNSQSKYDAITCNPPFFEESLKCPDKTRNTARHTDTLPYSILFEHGHDMLTDEGTLSIIIPADYLTRVQQECAYCSLFINETLYIKTTERKPAKRVLLAIGRHIKNSPRSSTAILMANAKRSEWYENLTKDFYLSQKLT